MTNRLLAFLALSLLAIPARAAEPVPGDACTAANNLQFSSGPEVAGGGGHAMLCQSGTWKSILSFNSAAQLTKLGNQACATNEILKFNGTTWACAADDAGSGGDNLGNHIATQALNMGNFNITNAGTITGTTITGTTFSGSGASLTALNATNLASGTVAAARMPALTGDVTMTAGTTATNIAAGVVTATELANDAVTIPKLAATGTASASTFLRGDNTWAAPPSGGGTLQVTVKNCSGGIGSCTVACNSGWLRTGCYSTSTGGGTSGSNGCTGSGGVIVFCARIN